MKNKPIATATKLLQKGYGSDPVIKRACDNTRWFGVIYLAENCESYNAIVKLGYRLPKKGDYYVFKRK